MEESLSKKWKKKDAEDLCDRLGHKRRLVWDVLNAREKKRVSGLCEKYKKFLDTGKTEREVVSRLVERAGRSGFKPLEDSRALAVGAVAYSVVGDKCIALARIGKLPVDSGVSLIAAHIDSPRLDFKHNPLYENTDLAFFKTHYYGGIRKHQWFARPLALHGRVVLADGKGVDIVVGEDDGDPVFTILDLLPHLAGRVQNNKRLAEAFVAEKMNVLAGSLPLGPEKVKDRFKLAVLHMLHEKYGMVEQDLLSAEIEIVPAGPARDVGFDRALVGGYGQDDRVSAFCAVEALFSAHKDGPPEKTCVAFLFDKEEVGSDGKTGARTNLVEDLVGDLLHATDQQASQRNVRKALARTRAISADVSPGLDPDYQDVHEKNNAAKLGYGVCLTKYTGSRGKVGSSDASAEYLGEIRRVFNESDIVWQTGTLGKVDAGGGGTIAKFLAFYGMDVVDCGVPVLSMHSPFEVAHKADILMCHRAYRAFFERMG
ncbi:MAG: aminopeptidase [Desulfatibacillaceae bacterium]